MLLIDLAALVWQPCAHLVYRASHCVLSAVLSLCCGLDDKQIAFAHIEYIHLKKPTAHGKIPFADFSPAFNLMQPHTLAHKLIVDFNLRNQPVARIVDFLSCRRQCVFVHGKCSDMRDRLKVVVS